MYYKSGFFPVVLLFLLSSYSWAEPQTVVPKDIYDQYGCQQCHTEDGGLAQEGLKQLKQGVG
jgi:hypothetical protein